MSTSVVRGLHVGMVPAYLLRSGSRPDIHDGGVPVLRARRVEAAARARGAALTDLGPDERDRLWALAKHEDDAGPV